MQREIVEPYEVRIGAFEGPMDLLLYLVQQSEVKPADISIAEIADQYLEWMKHIANADLSQAGDFLLMASRLMALKVRELLPKEQRTAEDDAEIDLSKDELIRQMLEYQRYKQVAKEMQEMELSNFGTCYRGRLEKTENENDTLADANIWQLFRGYQKSLKTHIAENVHHIELDDVTIEDRQQFIANTLQREGRVLFEDLLGRDPLPIVTVVTFMALMEMIKTDAVVFRQSELFGAIWIYRKKDNAEFAEEMANETRIYEPEGHYATGILEKIRERELARNSRTQEVPLSDALLVAMQLADQGKAVKDEDLLAILQGDLVPEKPAEPAQDSTVQISESEPADQESETVPTESGVENSAGEIPPEDPLPEISPEEEAAAHVEASEIETLVSEPPAIEEPAEEPTEEPTEADDSGEEPPTEIGE